MDIAISVKGVPIRLTEERWEHIISNKPYMESLRESVLEAIEKPSGFSAVMQERWSRCYRSEDEAICM